MTTRTGTWSARRRRLAPQLLIAFAVLLPFMGAATTCAGTLHAAPVLRLTAVPGHRIALHGTQWPAGDRLLVTVRYTGGTAGLALRATQGGAFTVAVDSITLCGKVLFTATDFSGRTASVRGPPLQCPTPTDPPRPHLAVTSGRPLRLHETRVLGVAEPRDVTLHVGDSLYYWTPGTTTPSFTPLVDARYLSLLGRGTTPPRACAQVNCAQGFYWRWVAVRTGDTGIDLSAACRKSTPPCMVPDLLLQVHILP